MTLSAEDRVRLCKALGFKEQPKYQKMIRYSDRAHNTGWIDAGGWPPIDTDDSWALNAMEAAARLGAEVQIQIPQGGGMKKVRVIASGRTFDRHGDTVPEAAAAAELAAVDAGALGQEGG